jgi:branched-chain amino acid transport system permease protein
VYYYLALALNLCALLLMRRFVFAPFGMTLRACRDAPLRADAIGIDIRTHQWLAFTIAGTFAGLSGGILAFLKGTIDPTWLAIPQSIEGLVMVLLGGVRTLIGPIVGAAAYHGLEIEFATITRFWPLVLGAIIVLLVLAFPQGIAGFAQARLTRARA